jgi:hypothetical protein
VNDILILIFCQTGFGDQYSSLITGYNALIDLKSIGFNPKIIISKGHKYFPQDVNLSLIYDFTSFKHNDIEFINPEQEENTTVGYELLLFTSIQIWVKRKTLELIEYVKNHKHITNYNHSFFSQECNLDFKIYNEDIFSNSKSLIFGKHNLIGVHFRCGDDTIGWSIEEISKHDFWGPELIRADKFIEQNDTNNIIICSMNRSVCEYFAKKFKNVFFNEFKNKTLPMHNIISRTEKISNIEEYIIHSKEIISEMIQFSYCAKIVSFNHFPSNFPLYGIINNENYSDLINRYKVIVTEF